MHEKYGNYNIIAQHENSKIFSKYLTAVIVESETVASYIKSVKHHKLYIEQVRKLYIEQVSPYGDTVQRSLR